MNQTCESCRYGAPVESTRWTGLECRREPPVQLNRPGAEWPHVSADGWCGEFVAAEAKAERPVVGKRETRPARAAVETAVDTETA